jgi:hypothetical protein
VSHTPGALALVSVAIAQQEGFESEATAALIIHSIAAGTA